MANQKDNIGRKRKETNYSTELTHYDRIHYSGCKFHMLTQVNIMCYLFISLPQMVLFNLLAYIVSLFI
jgi:hypothetical protein